MSECRLCPCLHFDPNQWRKTLCQHCFHGRSAHTDDPRATVPQWYYAKVEGPFTFEQMRHWLLAGHFNTDRLLVKSSEDAGSHFMPLKTLFPDESVAFLPSSAAGIDAEPESDLQELDVVSARAKLGWVSTYFGRGHAWHFIDAQGETQGPFSAENMVNWYKAGYFWNMQLLICHQGWDNFVTLQSILDASETMAALSPGAASAPSSPGSAGGDTAGHGGAVGVYEDASVEEDGVSPNGIVLSMSGDDAERRETVEPKSVAEVEVEPEAETHPEGSGDGDTGAADDALEWYYGDESGETQGPFTSSQMREWYEWDYFGGETLVRHDSVPEFCTIHELFPPEEGAALFQGSRWVDHYNALRA